MENNMISCPDVNNWRMGSLSSQQSRNLTTETTQLLLTVTTCIHIIAGVKAYIKTDVQSAMMRPVCTNRLWGQTLLFLSEYANTNIKQMYKTNKHPVGLFRNVEKAFLTVLRGLCDEQATYCTTYHALTDIMLLKLAIYNHKSPTCADMSISLFILSCFPSSDFR